jgi:hypothetical protein
MPDDLNFEQLSTVQSNKQLPPRTITAAATIAPTTFLTILSGTTAVATITPPVTGAHMIAIMAASTNSVFTTSGNIVGLTTGSPTQPSLFIYNPLTARYTRTVA